MKKEIQSFTFLAKERSLFLFIFIWNNKARAHKRNGHVSTSGEMHRHAEHCHLGWQRKLFSLWMDLILPSLIPVTSVILLCCRGWVCGWNSPCRATNSISIMCVVSAAELLYSSFSSEAPNKSHKILGDFSFSINFSFPVLPTVSLAIFKLHPYNLKRNIASWISTQNFWCQRNSVVFLQCHCLP